MSVLPESPSGGLIWRQSTISAFQRCPKQAYYYATEHAQHISSAMAYGSVVHHALHVLERYGDLGRAEATFVHYWHPDNLTEVADRPIDYWLPRQTYGGLRSRGLASIRAYWELRRDDDAEVLALEHPFTVALPDSPHWLHGTLDKLTVRRYRGKPYLSIEDFKTGVRPTYLRHNVQGHAYAYASTQREFWNLFADVGADPEELWARTRHWPRRFRWVDLREGKQVDGGWRSERDYARLRLAINEWSALVERGVFPMTLTGEACQYCPFRDTCGGVGVAADEEGRP